MISRRREERTNISVPIRIWGMDANGKPFSVPATTYDITRFGARIMGVRVPLAPGEIVGVQHESEKARFRVAWYGRPNSRLEGNVGLQALDWKKHIWGSHVQDSAPTLINANSEALNAGAPRYSSGIDPLLDRADDDRLPGFMAAPVAAPAPPSPNALARLIAAERRLATRYICDATAEIVDVRTGEPSRGTLREMSLVGCFIHTPVTLPHRAPIKVVVRVFGTEISCGAQVRHIEQGIGFGVKFTQFSEAEREKLESVIERLASEGTALIPESMRNTNTPQSRSQQMALAVEKLTSHLREMETIATRNASGLDPKLLRALRTHSEQARQAAFAVQQWIEFQDHHKDPAPLLSEAENRRVRASITLLRDLLSETEHENFAVDRPAVAELYAAAIAVYRRLAWLAERRHPSSVDKR